MVNVANINNIVQHFSGKVFKYRYEIIYFKMYFKYIVTFHLFRHNYKYF